MQNKLRKDFPGISSKHALKRALPSMSTQPLGNNIKQATLSNKQPPPPTLPFTSLSLKIVGMQDECVNLHLKV